MFDNLIVLFTDIHTYPATRACSMPSTAGAALAALLRRSRRRIRSGEGTPLEALRLRGLFDTQEPFEINCGHVTVVDIDEAENFKWEALARMPRKRPATETFVESDD